MLAFQRLIICLSLFPVHKKQLAEGNALAELLSRSNFCDESDFEIGDAHALRPHSLKRGTTALKMRRKYIAQRVGERVEGTRKREAFSNIILLLYAKKIAVTFCILNDFLLAFF